MNNEQTHPRWNIVWMLVHSGRSIPRVLVVPAGLHCVLERVGRLNTDMTNDEIQKRIDETAILVKERVSQWPAWKQNILVHNLQPMFDVGREPITDQQNEAVQ